MAQQDAKWLIDILVSNDLGWRENATQTIADMLQEAGNRKSLTERGAVDALSHSLLGGNEEHATFLGCSALLLLSLEPAAHKPMAMHETLFPRIAELLGSGTPDATRENASGIIRNIAGSTDTPTRTSIVAVPGLVPALADLLSTEFGAENASAALWALSCASPARSAMATSTHPALVNCAVSSSQHVVAVRRNVWSAIMNLSKVPECAPIWQHPDIASEIVRCVTTETDLPEVHSAMLGALYEVGRVPTLLPTDPALTDALVGLVARRKQGEEVDFALGALSRLVALPSSSERLATAENVQVVMDTVKTSKSDMGRLFAFGLIQQLVLSANVPVPTSQLLDIVTTASSTSSREVSAALGLLQVVAGRGEEDRAAIAERGLVDTAVQHVINHSVGIEEMSPEALADRQRVTISALGALTTFAGTRNKVTRQAIVEGREEAVLSQVSPMLLSDSETLQRYATSFLGAISSLSEVRIQLAEICGYDIGEALNRADLGVKVLDPLCRVVVNVCHNSTAQDTLTRQGVGSKLILQIQHVLEGLERVGEGPDAEYYKRGLDSAGKALINIDWKLAGPLLSETHLNIMDKALGVDDTDTQILVLNAVAAMCFTPHALKLFSGFVSRVLSVMAAEDSTLALKSAGCRVLHQLAQSAEIKDQIMNNKDALAMLVETAQSTSVEARDAAIAVISALAFSEAENTVGTLIQQGVLPALAKCLTDPSPMYACAALWGLTRSQAHRFTIVETEDLGEAIVAAFKKASNRGLQYLCLGVSNLCTLEESVAILDEDCGLVPVLVDLVEKEHGKIKRSLVNVLRCFPLSDTTLSEMLNKSLAEAGLPAWRPMQQGSVTARGRRGLMVGMGDSLGEGEDDALIANESRRHCLAVMKELVATEQSYCSSLQNLQDVFEKSLMGLKNAKSLGVAELFQEVGPVRVIHSNLLARLTEATSGPSDKWGTNIADVLVVMAPSLSDCVHYVDKFDSMMKVLDKIRKNKNAQKILDTCGRQTGLNLQAHLIMPVQRLPRIELMVKDLIKNMPPNSPDHGPMTSAYEAMKSACLSLNQQDEREFSDGRYKASAIALNVTGIPSSLYLLEPNRSFVFEGRMRSIFADGSVSIVNFYFFNDLILWSSEQTTYIEENTQRYVGHMKYAKKKLVVKPKVGIDSVPNATLGRSLRKGFMQGLAFSIASEGVQVTLLAKSDRQLSEWMTNLKGL